MTTQTYPSTTRPTDHDDLAAALSRTLGVDFLPARGDQLLAALVRQHAPNQVLWLLADLPTNREYASFAEVASVCGTGAMPGECPRWYA
ncbi:hypothetical protein GCM10027517_08510 [Phycicoccus ginsengisoli]